MTEPTRDEIIADLAATKERLRTMDVLEQCLRSSGPLETVNGFVRRFKDALRQAKP